jgi:chemotaxis protein histidine kinase CheA
LLASVASHLVYVTPGAATAVQGQFLASLGRSARHWSRTQRAALLNHTVKAGQPAVQVAATDAQDRLLCERVTGFLAPVTWHVAGGAPPSKRLVEHALAGWNNASATPSVTALQLATDDVARMLPPGHPFTGPAAAVALHALLTTQLAVPTALWTPWQAVLRSTADASAISSTRAGAQAVSVVSPPLPPHMCTSSLEAVRADAHKERLELCWGHSAICSPGEAAFNATILSIVTEAQDAQLAAMQALVTLHADAAISAAQSAIEQLEASLSPAARSAAVRSASVDARAGLDGATAVYRNTSAVEAAHVRLEKAIAEETAALEQAAKEYEATHLSAAVTAATHAANEAVHGCSPRLPLGKSPLTACGVAGGAAARQAVLDIVSAKVPWLADSPALERALGRAQRAGDDAAARLAAANDVAASAALAAGVANVTRGLQSDMAGVKVPMAGTSENNVTDVLTSAAAAGLRANVAHIADLALVMDAQGGAPALARAAQKERATLATRNGLAWLEVPALAGVKHDALRALRARTCHGRLTSFPRPVHTLVACTRAVHADWLSVRGPTFAESLMASILAKANASRELPDGMDALAAAETAAAFGFLPEAQAQLAAARGTGERAVRTVLFLAVVTLIHMFGFSACMDALQAGTTAAVAWLTRIARELGKAIGEALEQRRLAAEAAAAERAKREAEEAAAKAAAERAQAEARRVKAAAEQAQASKPAPVAPVTPASAPAPRAPAPPAWRAVAASDLLGGDDAGVPIVPPRDPSVAYVAALVCLANSGDDNSVRMLTQLPGPGPSAGDAASLSGPPVPALSSGRAVIAFHAAALRYGTGMHPTALKGSPWTGASYERMARAPYAQARPELGKSDAEVAETEAVGSPRAGRSAALNHPM